MQDTYSLLREFADSWALLALFCFFVSLFVWVWRLSARMPLEGDRLNLADTLRTAAPWQRLRGRDGDRVLVRPEDFRVARYRHRTESVTVFVVDASGSAASHPTPRR
mgnify:CR=1 FL=1